MKTRSEITSILILAAACGDNSMMTASSTSLTMTGGSLTSATEEGTDSSNSTTANTDPSAGSEPSASTDPTANNTSGPTTTTPGNTGPVFISFSANVTKVTEGQSVVFTAALTDPDGVGDIAGGSLLSEDEAFDFGPFIAAGQEGTYSISISWDQIHQAGAINFEDSEPARQFIAQFVDNGGNRVTANKSIALTCAGGSACEAACKDLGSDAANCGSCGRVCANGCNAGDCAPTWSKCFTENEGIDTCAQACQSYGEACVENGCGDVTKLYYSSVTSCMQDVASSPVKELCDHNEESWPKPAIRCCCTDPS